MNNKDQENGALREPLIFTVTDYGFIMALYLDSLGRSNPTAFLRQNLFARGRTNRILHAKISDLSRN
jgi:hypothetical protein